MDSLYLVETSDRHVHHCSNHHSIGWIACCDMELYSECYMCILLYQQVSHNYNH